MLTVLSRLEKKGFVTAIARARPHRYRAAATREEHMADLMHEVLGGATTATAVLERFVGQVSPEEAEALRRLLDAATDDMIAASAALARSRVLLAWPVPVAARSRARGPPGRPAPRSCSGRRSPSPVGSR